MTSPLSPPPEPEPRAWSGRWAGHINHGNSGTTIYEALHNGEPTGISLQRRGTRTGKLLEAFYIAPNGDEYDLMTQPGGAPLRAWLEDHRLRVSSPPERKP